MSLPRANSADICLLLEGTFPYVSGGVSSWVNQIIRGFPEYTFACCFVGSRPEDYGEMKYDLPDNVVHLEVHYLHDQGTKAEKKAAKKEKRKALPKKSATCRFLPEHGTKTMPQRLILLAAPSRSA